MKTFEELFYKLVSFEFHGWTFDAIIVIFIFLVGGGGVILRALKMMKEGSMTQNFEKLDPRVRYFIYGIWIAIIVIAVLFFLPVLVFAGTSYQNIFIILLRFGAPLVAISAVIIGYLYGRAQLVKMK